MERQDVSTVARQFKQPFPSQLLNGLGKVEQSTVITPSSQNGAFGGGQAVAVEPLTT